MVFKFHTAFALGLLAMVAGTYLLIKARAEGTGGKVFAKILGWFVIVTAFLGLVCSTSYSIKYWKAGRYCPSKMGKHGMHKMHMMKHMKECPLMKKMMEEKEEAGD
jgi:hypothetical protein